MATTNGNLHHRHADCGSPSSCGRAWHLRRKMPKSTGENNRVRSRNPNIFWPLTTVAIVLHLVAVFVVFFLCKDVFGVANWSKFLFPASYCTGNEQRLEISAVVEEEISVSSTSGSIPNSMDSIINLDHGDPTMYEKFWKQAGNAAELIIPGAQTMSYFSDVTNLCWFLEPLFATEVRRLHRLVGNAVIGPDSYIIVGTGSSQLFQAALFALSTSPEVFGGGGGRPLPVVSSVPYYSSYPAATDLLQSALFRWAGDVSSLEKDDDDPYIEVVCSPSNPDGLIKAASIRSSNQNVIHDLAYYWPQYTAITAPANHNLMLFTASKCTGHAGMRLGWAIVKNKDVAKRMMKFIEISTIGVSKDSQLRAAKILKTVSDHYELEAVEDFTKLFHFGGKTMRDRWEKLRAAVAASDAFSLPVFQPEYCNFMKENTLPSPAFAWLKCERDIDDCENFLRQNHKILTRSGKHFGADAKHVRVSMLDRVETFDMFIERLLSIDL
ncbi:tryptophan aminotransferase-related protein 2-like [Phalaenopsis equestris]|uniref:tryptophan aminotransferase-related protein 2-like n=1 Tax=Phalaenopsis equestris TaxID=78828 RepID=UPI0009E3D0A3|nr:tryptophan aminotransferase-related protein 2-like [Phalaenopsis equestris]